MHNFHRFAVYKNFVNLDDSEHADVLRRIGIKVGDESGRVPENVERREYRE